MLVTLSRKCAALVSHQFTISIGRSSYVTTSSLMMVQMAVSRFARFRLSSTMVLNIWVPHLVWLSPPWPIVAGSLFLVPSISSSVLTHPGLPVPVRLSRPRIWPRLAQLSVLCSIALIKSITLWWLVFSQVSASKVLGPASMSSIVSVSKCCLLLLNSSSRSARLSSKARPLKMASLHSSLVISKFHWGPPLVATLPWTPVMPAVLSFPITLKCFSVLYLWWYRTMVLLLRSCSLLKVSVTVLSYPKRWCSSTSCLPSSFPSNSIMTSACVL